MSVCFSGHWGTSHHPLMWAGRRRSAGLWVFFSSLPLFRTRTQTPENQFTTHLLLVIFLLSVAQESCWAPLLPSGSFWVANNAVGDTEHRVVGRRRCRVNTQKCLSSAEDWNKRPTCPKTPLQSMCQAGDQSPPQKKVGENTVVTL